MNKMETQRKEIEMGKSDGKKVDVAVPTPAERRQEEQDARRRAVELEKTAGGVGATPTEVGVFPGPAEVGVMLSITLELPVAAPHGGHHRRHVDLQLTRDQAAGLDRLARGLDGAGAEVSYGTRGVRRVVTMMDAVRWLAERVQATTRAEAGREQKPQMNTDEHG